MRVYIRPISHPLTSLVPPRSPSSLPLLFPSSSSSSSITLFLGGKRCSQSRGESKKVQQRGGQKSTPSPYYPLSFFSSRQLGDCDGQSYVFEIQWMVVPVINDHLLFSSYFITGLCCRHPIILSPCRLTSDKLQIFFTCKSCPLVRVFSLNI